MIQEKVSACDNVMVTITKGESVMNSEEQSTQEAFKKYISDKITSCVTNISEVRSVDSNTLQPVVIKTVRIALPVEAAIDAKVLLGEDELHRLLGKAVAECKGD